MSSNKSGKADKVKSWSFLVVVVGTNPVTPSFVVDALDYRNSVVDQGRTFSYCRVEPLGQINLLNNSEDE